MSLVLVTAMENFIIFMSDGRVTRNKTIFEVEILQENFKKLFRVNSNICIAFAGSKEPCEETLKVLDDYNLNSITLDETFEIILKKSKEVYSRYINQGIPIKIFMAIGGKQQGEIKFRTFSSPENFKILEFSPKKDDLSYAFLSPESIDNSYFINQIQKNAPCTLNNLRRAMGLCINDVSAFCKSVNALKFEEIIEK